MTLDPLGERMYLLAQVKRGSPFRLQVPGACGGQEMVLEELLAGLEGGKNELTLVIVMILLARALVCPQSHLRNGCTCWSRCSMEPFSKCRRQAIVGDTKGALKSSWKVSGLLSTISILLSALILLAGAFVSP